MTVAEPGVGFRFEFESSRFTGCRHSYRFTHDKFSIVTLPFSPPLYPNCVCVRSRAKCFLHCHGLITSCEALTIRHNGNSCRRQSGGLGCLAAVSACATCIRVSSQLPLEQRQHSCVHHVTKCPCCSRAVHELSAATKQKQAHILDLAKQTAEQGIGDNDLKRLKRQFDSNKATYVNIDQKQRFMQGTVPAAAALCALAWQLVLCCCDVAHAVSCRDNG